MQNNNQISTVSKNDQHKPGKNGENVQSQSIFSQESTPGQTAICDLSVRQETELLSKGNSILRFIKKNQSSNELDPNNNDKNNSKIESNSDKPTTTAEHQPVYRSLSVEPPTQTTSVQSSNLITKELEIEKNLEEQSTAGQLQSNSLPIIQLSSETDLEPNINQLPAKLNYRKSSDITHKRTKSGKKSSKNISIPKEENLDDTNSTNVNRTRSFNSPKKSYKKQLASTYKHHHTKHNQTKPSSRSSSIDSNLHTLATKSPEITVEQQLERQFDRRARQKESSRCKHYHRHHRKSSARLYSNDQNCCESINYNEPLIAPQPGTLSYSRSSEDIRGCSCSHSSELTPTVFLSNNGTLLYNNGYFSSTSALVADSSSTTTGLKLHHSPINANTSSFLPTPFLLLPDYKNISLSPSPTYLSSYSAVPSYTTTPVHKHKHRSKSTKGSRKHAVSPIPDHLAVDSIESKLTKSNSVRLSRTDSKSKCTKDNLCRKCKRKTSLNSTLRGQSNYAEYTDNKHFGLPASYSPSPLVQQHCTSRASLTGTNFAQPIHLANFAAAVDQLNYNNTLLANNLTGCNQATNPILLHNPLHSIIQHSGAVQSVHEPITKTTSLNPSALGHIVSPVHLCQLNDALLKNNLTTATNPLRNQLDNPPSHLSVPDLSRLTALNATIGNQPITFQCTHMHPFQNVQPASDQKNLEEKDVIDAKVSAAFTKLYRNKPAPDYFSNLFSENKSDNLDKPKLLDYLLTGADLSKLLSKSSQLDNESASLDKNIKADVNRKTSSTESINLKKTTTTTTVNDTTTSATVTTTTTTTTFINNASKPLVVKKISFKDKLNQITDKNHIVNESDNLKDKDTKDKIIITETRENELENKKLKDHSGIDQVPNKQQLDKRKTSNRNPMLNLLRKAQQTAEADAPPSFEQMKSSEKDDKYDDKNDLKIENNTKLKSTNKLLAQSSTEKTLPNDQLVKSDIIETEPQHQEQTQPSKSRLFLMRMLVPKKETNKQLSRTSKSLEHPNGNKSIKNQITTHHTVDLPQTQEEIAESTDELHALRTNLMQKRSSVTNCSKSIVGAPSRSTLRRNSLSKEETNSTTSAMSKLRKKAASGLAVRFAKLTHYASSTDSGSIASNANDTTAATSTNAKSTISTISGKLSNLTNRSISLDKTSNSNAGMSSTGLKNTSKRSLANFKKSTNSTSVASTITASSSTNPANRNHRYSVTAENMPKLTDLRKILHPEEEHRDFETVCKGFWDSFIDCQCIDCTFNNAAKFITAFILFLTIALVINTITISTRSSNYEIDRTLTNLNISLHKNLTINKNSTIKLTKFINLDHNRPLDELKLNKRTVHQSLKLIESTNYPFVFKRQKKIKPIYLKNSSPLFPKSKFENSEFKKSKIKLNLNNDLKTKLSNENR